MDLLTILFIVFYIVIPTILIVVAVGSVAWSTRKILNKVTQKKVR